MQGVGGLMRRRCEMKQSHLSRANGTIHAKPYYQRQAEGDIVGYNLLSLLSR
jgi:hypothetical protein